MADDRERIEQIRARYARDDMRVTSQDMRPSSVPVPEMQPDAAATALGVDTKSPWLRDRVTLSLEAQIHMIEMRANYRLNTADLGYTNRTSITSVSPGIYVKVEPTGCYRMVYNDR